MEKVAAKRATFSRANLLAEVLRQVAGVRFADPNERVTVAEHVTDLAVAQAVRLTPAEPAIELLPEGLRRPDATSRLRPRDAIQYTTAPCWRPRSGCSLPPAPSAGLRGCRSRCWCRERTLAWT